MAQRISDEQLKQLVEAALFVAGRPLALSELQQTLLAPYQPSKERLRRLLNQLADDYRERGINLNQSAGGYRFVSNPAVSPLLGQLWPERAPRYSRATLETLALIAYRQPITRAEIEEVRGVSVASSIIRSMEERGWIKVVGHRQVPGRPALYATTAAFLDYFGLASLEQLPALMDNPGPAAGDEQPPISDTTTPIPAGTATEETAQ